MSEEWNDKLFDNWQSLRTQCREAKKSKDHSQVIKVCKEIIELDQKAKFIGIMVSLFNRDIANSYLKLDDKENAIKYYELACNGFTKYREENELNKPTDWLVDIERIKKKIEKLK